MFGQTGTQSDRETDGDTIRQADINTQIQRNATVTSTTLVSWYDHIHHSGQFLRPPQPPLLVRPILPPPVPSPCTPPHPSPYQYTSRNPPPPRQFPTNFGNSSLQETVGAALGCPGQPHWLGYCSARTVTLLTLYEPPLLKKFLMWRVLLNPAFMCDLRLLAFF